jgi:hypothetical protein
MDINLLKQRVKGAVTFVKLVNSEVWYVCNDGFEFAIPLEDTVGGEFTAKDDGTFFMRWISKHMKMLDAARQPTEADIEAASKAYSHLSEGAID